MSPTYTLRTHTITWRIEHDPAGRWMLKRNRARDGWIPVGVFSGPEDAAMAVAHGKTGELDWDALSTRLAAAACLLGAWTIS
jgi:hypothetical protein